MPISIISSSLLNETTSTPHYLFHPTKSYFWSCSHLDEWWSSKTFKLNLQIQKSMVKEGGYWDFYYQEMARSSYQAGIGCYGKLVSKLHFLRSQFRVWHKEHFANFAQKKYLSSPHHLSARCYQRESRSLYHNHLEFSIISVLLKRSYGKQRSWIFWLKEGDNNTQYFHWAANARRRANHISYISDASSTLFDPKDLGHSLTAYYSSLFGQSHALSLSVAWNTLYLHHDWQANELEASSSESFVR